MDTITYVIAVFILAFSIQLQIIWVSLAILIFMLINLRSIPGILLTLVSGAVFWVVGGDLKDDILYIAIALVAFAYFVGVKPAEEAAGGMSPDMLAALQGMGGGGEMGGFGGMGGMH